MRFTFTGTLKDAEHAERVSLTFADGRLDGDLRALLVAKARAEALARRGEGVGPPGMTTHDPRAFTNPQAVYWLLRQHVFDRIDLEIRGGPEGGA